MGNLADGVVGLCDFEMIICGTGTHLTATTGYLAKSRKTIYTGTALSDK